MRRLAPGFVLFVVGATSCAVPGPADSLTTQIWYLNRTSAAVHVEFASRETTEDGVLMSDGGTTADVPPCEVGGSGVGLMPDQRQTWSVTVEGTVVITSDADLPVAGAGQALEILVDIPPDGEPTVRAAVVPARPIDDTSRYDELAAGLDCS